jgi:hypothetical protein
MYVIALGRMRYGRLPSNKFGRSSIIELGVLLSVRNQKKASRNIR